MTSIKWKDLPFDNYLTNNGWQSINKHPTIDGWQCIKTRYKSYNDQNHTRMVWEDKNLNKILKIWPKNYIRGKYFEQAYKKGFFDDNVAPSNIQIIIDNEDICRGYSMTKGLNVNNINDDILDKFSDLLIKKVKETNLFYYDLCSKNLMLFGDKYGLIDLDSIYPFDEYEEWRDYKHKGGKMVKHESYKRQLDKLAKGIHDK